MSREGMTDYAQDGQYTFVSYKGSELPKDPNVRNSIHRRAMKHGAAIRKRNGGYGRYNIGQFPVQHQILEVQGEDPPSSIIATLPDSMSHEHQKEASRITEDPKSTKTMSMSIHNIAIADAYRHTSFQRSHLGDFLTKSPHDYSLLSLATPLTVLHLGISSLSYFRPDLDCIGRTLSKMSAYPESQRLLSYIPSRYGHVPSITYATDCLLARLGEIARTQGILSSEGSVTALKLHTKALRSIQEAIDDESLRLMPETLCAVELLAIYELLHGPFEMNSWISHAGGASRLIELQGPDRFRTNFELSLFMTCAGSIVTEAFINGKTCFLGEARWQRVIQAAIRNDPLIPPEQVHLFMMMWGPLSNGPNLFKAVEDFLSNPAIDQHATYEDLIRRLCSENEHLKAWLIFAEQYQYGSAGEWQSLLHNTTVLLQNCKTVKGSPDQHVGWRVLQGTFLLCCLIKTRLLFALSPSRFPELEITCQELAREAVSMSTDYASYQDERLIYGLFMAEVVWMAEAVIETKEAWSESPKDIHLRQDQGYPGTIEKWKFEAWCRAMGRQVSQRSPLS
ncbi:hypothetical protein F5884DRAFT_779171 [Xylogone sp. PMI_703]|nr:hypothetical protein F5884DRAFT_779171 [Xylogone sp. PMI_703]